MNIIGGSFSGYLTKSNKVYNLSRMMSSLIYKSAESIKFSQLEKPIEFDDFIKNPKQNLNNFNIKYFTNANGVFEEDKFDTRKFPVSDIKKAQEYEMYINNNFDNKLNYSRYSNFYTKTSINKNPTILLKTNVVDLLLFNKNFAINSVMEVERILPFINLIEGYCETGKKNNYTNIDDWGVHQIRGDLFNDLDIQFNIKNNSDFKKYDYDYDYNYGFDYSILKVAKTLLTLMNETDPTELNMINYYWVYRWINDYKLFFDDIYMHKTEKN